jgi:hypothetical protein
MRRITSLLLLLMIAAGLLAVQAVQAAPVVIANWAFDSTTPDGNTATGTTTAATSLTTTSLAFVGGISNTFVTGNGAGTDNSGVNTTTYPAQGTGNKTAGVRFNVSTVGYGGIIMSFDVRASNTAANTLVVQYSTDGTNFIDFQTVTIATATVFATTSVDFTAITALRNNANAAFRIVTAFATPTQYTGVVATYNTAGTLRYDNVSFTATTNPTPVTLTSFTVHEQGQTMLEWTTASEHVVFGFEVWRSDSGSYADARIVSGNLIPATGDGITGATYRWSDPTAQPNTPYSYWLLVRQNGTPDLYGPLLVGQPDTSSFTYQQFLPLIAR